MAIDVHQHLWPEPLLAALARRRSAPLLRREASGWVLEAPGEAPAVVDLADHDPDRRRARVHGDGLERAYVALSSPLGIEALPRAEAEPLLDAWHEGAAALPDGFGAWAAPSVAAPDPAALAARLDGGFAGACLPAEALASPAGYARCRPLLEVLEARDAPLFVHPGAPAATPAGAPSWWSAMTDYVASMQTAWHALWAWGRPAHPALRVCFAMLAGLAPLQRERLVARGGPRPVVDPGVFLDTSSYGPRAIDATIRELGVDALVHGSDRPLAEPADPGLGDAVRVALRERNPARLLREARA